MSVKYPMQEIPGRRTFWTVCVINYEIGNETKVVSSFPKVKLEDVRLIMLSLKKQPCVVEIWTENQVPECLYSDKNGTNYLSDLLPTP